MTTLLDFIPGKIPLTAFTRQCPGSHVRPVPVVVGNCVARYQCSECGAWFGREEVGDVLAPVAPGHERMGD